MIRSLSCSPTSPTVAGPCLPSFGAFGVRAFGALSCLGVPEKAWDGLMKSTLGPEDPASTASVASSLNGTASTSRIFLPGGLSNMRKVKPSPAQPKSSPTVELKRDPFVDLPCFLPVPRRLSPKSCPNRFPPSPLPLFVATARDSQRHSLDSYNAWPGCASAHPADPRGLLALLRGPAARLSARLLAAAAALQADHLGLSTSLNTAHPRVWSSQSASSRPAASSPPCPSMSLPPTEPLLRRLQCR
ncbi:hypothetical protein F5884DRAFT_286626 [Xylogone sp. PMI_703]|nr:hypothetical protein F5884DRAFT_286626 [Xylogone sp. PMI_703]